MLDLERVAAAVAEAGPLDDEISEVRQLDVDRWGIAFGDLVVEVECDHDADRLVFTAPIGPLPNAKRTEWLEFFLAYSSLWRQNGGCRICLTKVGGDALLMVDLPRDLIAAAAVARSTKAAAVRALQLATLTAASDVPKVEQLPTRFDELLIRI